MSSTTHPDRHTRPPVSPLRRSRIDHTETIGRPAAERLADDLLEDGRTSAPHTAGAAPQPAPPAGRAPVPPVLARGSVLVAFDGGAGGRAALDYAIRALPGTLGIVHLYDAVDPLRAAQAGGLPGAGVELLHAVHEDNERGREAAESIAAAGVAIAQEAGRQAVAVVRRQEDAVGRDAHLRDLAERHEAGHVVLAAAPRSRLRRLVLGPGTAERLAADPPCPCTVVPARQVAS